MLCVVLLGVGNVFTFFGGGGMTVWFHHKIYQSANERKLVEEELLQLDNQINGLDAQMATALNPVRLREHAQELGLKLQFPDDAQIVREFPALHRKSMSHYYMARNE